MDYASRQHRLRTDDLSGRSAVSQTIPANACAEPCSGYKSVQWTIIIPFFNEEGFIARALRSVEKQKVAFELILVDNGSTDESCSVATAECERLKLHWSLLSEPRLGKVQALATGLSHVRTPFVATFDADTTYPATYLQSAQRLLETESCVAAQAYYILQGWPRWRRSLAAAKLAAATWLLPHQCHNGGAGQVFCTEALRRSGGFDPGRWDFILEDHEVIHRISRLGEICCGGEFYCSPARRELDQPSVRWSFLERLAYHLTPAALQSYFFYEFLGPRLAARQSMSFAMRGQRA